LLSNISIKIYKYILSFFNALKSIYLHEIIIIKMHCWLWLVTESKISMKWATHKFKDTNKMEENWQEQIKQTKNSLSTCCSAHLAIINCFCLCIFGGSLFLHWFGRITWQSWLWTIFFQGLKYMSTCSPSLWGFS
jgi:hypothetical protein